MIKTKFSALLLFALLLLALLVLLTPLDGEAGNGFLRFIGRFHVLVLHFPISLLLLAPFLDLLANTKRFHSIKEHVPLIWWLASISALFTVTLGILLASNEGYTLSEVQQHLIGGISVAVLAVICTILRKNIQSKAATKAKSNVLSVSYTACTAALIFSVMYAAHQGGNLVHGETYLTNFAPAPLKTLLQTPSKTLDLAAVEDPHFTKSVRPLLTQYCFGCHDKDTQKGNVQLNILNPDFINGYDAEHWHAALDMINSGDMPPAKKKQPTVDERRVIVDWMTQGIMLAKESKKGKGKMVIRRLTKQQYTNSLQNLLGLKVNFGNYLPDDPISDMGFSNNAELLSPTPLHYEYFRKIAKSALDKTINIGEKPPISHYRMHFGNNISKKQKNLSSRGFLHVPVDPKDFYTEVIDEHGQALPTHTVDSVNNQLFTGSLRGSDRRQFMIENDGIRLYSAKPHIEIVEQGKPGAWNVPSPNLAMQIKDAFPREGRFMLRVKASSAGGFEHHQNSIQLVQKGTPLISLNKNYKPVSVNKNKHTIKLLSETLVNTSTGSMIKHPKYPRVWIGNVKPKNYQVVWSLNLKDIKHELYQLDIAHLEVDKKVKININIDHDARISGFIKPTGKAKVGEPVVSTLALVRLSHKRNKYRFTIKGDKNFPGISDVIFTPVAESAQLARDFPPKSFKNSINENNIPSLQPYIGNRKGNGTDYNTFAEPVYLNPDGQPQVISFQGQLEHLPVPGKPNEEHPKKLTDKFVSLGSMKVGIWNSDMVKTKKQKGSAVKIHYIEFEAPYYAQWPTKEHNAIFFDSKHEKNSDDYAIEVISAFAEKAYRRPLIEAELNEYINFWRDIKDSVTSFEEGIKEVLATVLVSPSFLYLAEPQFNEQIALNETKNDKGIIDLIFGKKVQASELAINFNEYALASRLSYFLWNTSPDKTLLDLAKNGQLAAQLPAQITRMLNDKKVKQFVSVFAKEWLKLERHELQNIDIDSYLDYSRYVKKDMPKETINFITKLIQDDLSLLNIIESDFLMLNQNLAEFYGIENVVGHEFRAVKLAKNDLRGGLLTQGAFLTGHSDGVHGHPVKRAVWLKEKILGDPPPPPPPNVPTIDSETPGFEKLTLKQQLELHRDKESCRDCHAKIDPYGIVFESFDAVGRVRTQYKGAPIDSSTLLPNGKTLSGVLEMQKYLLEEKSDKVALSVIKHLLAYALGRDISFYDDGDVDAILQKVKNNNYKMQALIEAVITSPLFFKSQEKV